MWFVPSFLQQYCYFPHHLQNGGEKVVTFVIRIKCLLYASSNRLLDYVCCMGLMARLQLRMTKVIQKFVETCINKHLNQWSNGIQKLDQLVDVSFDALLRQIETGWAVTTF
jgi:hypothetical protein